MLKTLARVVDVHNGVADALRAFTQIRTPQLRRHRLASRWLTPLFQTDNPSDNLLPGSPVCQCHEFIIGKTDGSRSFPLIHRAFSTGTSILHGHVRPNPTRLYAEPRVRFIAALAAVALTSGALAANAVVGRESGAAVRARVVELVNAARSNGRKCGSERFAAAPPLSASRELNEAAAGHARDMARRKFFDHRGSRRQPAQGPGASRRLSAAPHRREHRPRPRVGGGSRCRLARQPGSLREHHGFQVPGTSALVWPPAAGAARSTGCRASARRVVRARPAGEGTGHVSW